MSCLQTKGLFTFMQTNVTSCVYTTCMSSVSLLIITFAVFSIASKTKWARTTADYFAIFIARYIRVAGIIGTVRNFYTTVWTSEANVAVARVIVDKVNASS